MNSIEIISLITAIIAFIVAVLEFVFFFIKLKKSEERIEKLEIQISQYTVNNHKTNNQSVKDSPNSYIAGGDINVNR